MHHTNYSSFLSKYKSRSENLQYPPSKKYTILADRKNADGVLCFCGDRRKTVHWEFRPKYGHQSFPVGLIRGHLVGARSLVLTFDEISKGTVFLLFFWPPPFSCNALYLLLGQTRVSIWAIRRHIRSILGRLVLPTQSRPGISLPITVPMLMQ